MKKLDENLEAEIAGLNRVGFDLTGETKRSGTFLVADDNTAESSSNEENLIVMPISFAIEVYDWVKDLMFSLVEMDQDEYTKEVSQQKELLGSFIYVKEGAKIEAPFQSCFFRGFCCTRAATF